MGEHRKYYRARAGKMSDPPPAEPVPRGENVERIAVNVRVDGVIVHRGGTVTRLACETPILPGQTTMLTTFPVTCKKDGCRA